MGLNKVMLMGHVGKDPEVRTLESQNKVAQFSLATTERYKDKNGERQEKTEWHNIIFWGKRAEVVEKYVQKGSKLYVEGKITTRKWQDKDGNDRYTTEIVASDFQFVAPKTDNAGSGGGGQQQAPSKPAPAASSSGSSLDDIDDDLPF